MALTSQAVFDIVNQTQTISFYQGVTLLDQIVYSSDSVTFSSISTFNLSKSDVLLYIKYINTFLLAFQTNFNPSTSNLWPLSLFEISETNVGVVKIIYTQNSQGTNVYTITYLPLAASGSFSARANPVVITLAEFLMTINMLNQYNNQVALN